MSKRGFGPITQADSRALLLGSMPSVESLAKGRYYAHPRNAFWPLLFLLLEGVRKPAPRDDSEYAACVALLGRWKIALWDVVQECERKGSADADIREARLNDVPGLLRRLPIRLVAFNGGTAARLGMKAFPEALEGVRVLRLPSTSPAYVKPLETKVELWGELKRALLDADART